MKDFLVMILKAMSIKITNLNWTWARKHYFDHSKESL